MACKNRSKVYLGYEDEYITEKHRSIVTFATNKIGGKPNLHSNESTLPLISCRLCGLNQLLVVQLYAPLENSKYHRTLYIFACINSNCWNQNESWTCLRIQSLEEKSITETKIQTTSPPPTTSWLSGADDWDEDDDDNNDNITEPNGNNMLENKSYKKLNLFMKSMDLDDELNKDLSNLKVDDPNANSPTRIESPIGGGAVGRLDSPQASAEIEGEESEVVCIDTPTKPQYNLINLLQNASSHLNHPFENSDMKSNVNITFTEIFISVDEEDLTNDITHHVRELFAEYQRSNPDIQVDSLSISTDEKINEATIEKCEKSLPKHGDKIFHNFLSQIQKNPGQLLRYCRDNTASLFLYPHGKTVKACEKCGSERIFEVQLLPTLIPKLKLTPSNDKNFQIEFGTVLVFTCARSCWSTIDLYQEEFVIVQAERL
ncbi:hypothetical protein PV327_000010 [Microctonus hyperodae]|uniref:Programmed cell death protein 2 C-terminal domain-containing protein n=1 Tax=Microctonus hyperodae TaxID=165561 RepID=A0AA39G698_MICHY|nr:hypothetical protein PV327_000010 [Microctonus hyperodae]